MPATEEFEPLELVEEELFFVVVVVVGGSVVTVTTGARSEYRLDPLGYQSGNTLIEVVVVDCSATAVLIVEVLVDVVFGEA